MKVRIITQPTVVLVAHTVFVGHPGYPIPADGDNATRAGSFAAKGCYDSFGFNGRANETNQRGIIASRHGSVLEHVSASLFIEGITRALSLELNRHRHFAISQRSTRYTAEDDAAIVLDPYFAGLWARPDKDLSEREHDLIEGHINCARAAFAEYNAEVSALMASNPDGLTATDLRKWARGKARNILPHALETRGTWTGNLRAWRHFIESRSDRHAEAEIRRLAAAVFAVLSAWAPLYFEDYTAADANGLSEYQTEYRKI